jgi:hypothetical protein
MNGHNSTCQGTGATRQSSWLMFLKVSRTVRFDFYLYSLHVILEESLLQAPKGSTYNEILIACSEIQIANQRFSSKLGIFLYTKPWDQHV